MVSLQVKNKITEKHTRKHTANLYIHDGRALPQGNRLHKRRKKKNDRATLQSNPSCPNQLVMALPSWAAQKVTDEGWVCIIYFNAFSCNIMVELKLVIKIGIKGAIHINYYE